MTVDSAKAFLKKWWPSILTILTTIATMLTPWVKEQAILHPDYAVLISGAWAVLLHNLTAPKNANP